MHYQKNDIIRKYRNDVITADTLIIGTNMASFNYLPSNKGHTDRVLSTGGNGFLST